MRVALIHSYYSRAESSGENIVVDAQQRALADAGFDTRIFSVSTDDLIQQSGYKARTAVHVATGSGRSPVDELRAFRPDIVHVHNLFPNWGTKWLRDWDGPVVATVHNFRAVCAAGTLFRDGHLCTLCPDHGSINAVKYGCYKGSKLASTPLAIRNRNGVAGDAVLVRADRVVVLSARSKELYARFGVPMEKLELIPNFVEDRNTLPIQSTGSAWVFTGRLSPEKGIVSLLRNWTAGRTLHVYGDGPSREEVRALSVGNIIYKGPVAHERIPEILSNAKGLIFPSEWPEGGIPQSYVEALAAGRPIVAKQGSSAADDVETSGVGAVFTDWGDLASALDAVETSLESHALRARQHYEEQFTVQKWVDAATVLYATLSSGQSS